MCFDILDCLVFIIWKRKIDKNVAKSLFKKKFFFRKHKLSRIFEIIFSRDHKLSRIGLFRIFKSMINMILPFLGLNQHYWTLQGVKCWLFFVLKVFITRFALLWCMMFFFDWCGVRFFVINYINLKKYHSDGNNWSIKKCQYWDNCQSQTFSMQNKIHIHIMI